MIAKVIWIDKGSWLHEKCFCGNCAKDGHGVRVLKNQKQCQKCGASLLWSECDFDIDIEERE